MFLDETCHWATEIRIRSARARTAIDYLRSEDLIALGDVLIIGSFLARRFLEEAEHGRRSVEEDSFHFAKDTVLRLLELKERTVSLKGCMFIDLTSNSPNLRLDAEETLGLYDVFSQIVHADPIELWKSPQPSRPCFWFASQYRVRNKNKPKFYRIGWSEYADLLEQVADAACPVERS